MWNEGPLNSHLKPEHVNDLCLSIIPHWKIIVVLLIRLGNWAQSLWFWSDLTTPKSPISWINVILYGLIFTKVDVPTHLKPIHSSAQETNTLTSARMTLLICLCEPWLFVSWIDMQRGCILVGKVFLYSSSPCSLLLFSHQNLKAHEASGWVWLFLS